MKNRNVHHLYVLVIIFCCVSCSVFKSNSFKSYNLKEFNAEYYEDSMVLLTQLYSELSYHRACRKDTFEGRVKVKFRNDEGGISHSFSESTECISRYLRPQLDSLATSLAFNPSKKEILNLDLFYNYVGERIELPKGQVISSNTLILSDYLVPVIIFQTEY